MKNTAKAPKKQSNFGGIFTALAIPLSFVTTVLVYLYVFGNPIHFEGNNPENLPLPGDYFGIVYKGGPIVPILMGFFLIVVIFSIERFLAIRRAKGAGSVPAFVRGLKDKLANDDVDGALKSCDKQRGVVANVLRSVVLRYQKVSADKAMTKEQAMAAIQKEVEDSTSLELPGLEQNMPILSTLVSCSTLVALLGTVLGMIRAFAALANAGAPDSVALSAGISEALVNTAIGIGTSAIAVITYNYFATQIDHLTFSIDEAGYSIVNTYAEKN
jgi:biopolymer transport protein ExbB